MSFRSPILRSSNLARSGVESAAAASKPESAAAELTDGVAFLPGFLEMVLLSSNWSFAGPAAGFAIEASLPAFLTRLLFECFAFSFADAVAGGIGLSWASSANFGCCFVGRRPLLCGTSSTMASATRAVSCCTPCFLDLARWVVGTLAGSRWGCVVPAEVLERVAMLSVERGLSDLGKEKK